MSRFASALSTSMKGGTGELVVLVSEDGTWSHHPWQEVHDRAANVADRLVEEGVSAVGLVGDPTVEFISAILGAVFAGAAVSLLPGPVRGADPAQWAQVSLARFRASGVGLVLSQDENIGLLRAATDDVGIQDVGLLAHAQRSAGFVAPFGDRDVAILQGTAGSTGTPRTAVLSPSAALANYRGIVQRVNLSGSDRGHSWLPLYHDMGLAFLFSSILGGCDLWQAPARAFAASPFDWLKWLSTSRATFTAAPNLTYTLIGRLSRHVSDIDLSSLRFALNGGELVDCAGCELFATEMARFGFSASSLSPSYGLAESTCAVTISTPGAGLEVDEVTVDTATGPSTLRHAVLGRALPGMEVRLRPTEIVGVHFADREVGEVEIRGASLMSGYCGEPSIDSASWLATGDLGYLVDDALVVCGRMKELITVAGRNVFPAEVERVAAQVRGIREGAVVAIGTSGTALRQGVVITAEFRGSDERAARTEIVRRVASQCGVVPTHVVFVKPGSLLRTSSGKLRRIEIRRNLEDTNQ